MLKFLKRKKIKVFALIGRSGTGKSFRAQFVASEHSIPLIIDDGLLIKGNRILAGKSAKQELNFVTAVKRALFQEPEHLEQTLKALEKEKFRRILILGTSEKMVNKIASQLNLPEPTEIIHIEEIATKEEIEIAMRVRYTEGKHVIPVPPLQITRSYPSIVYDSIRVGFHGKKKFFSQKETSGETTLVKPEFTKLEENIISESAFRQMIGQCLYEYEDRIKVGAVTYTFDQNSYAINVVLRMPSPMTNLEVIEMQDYIADSLEKYGGIMIKGVTITTEVWK